MMTYSMLGKNGRLGNQMFQYAALMGTSFIRGKKFMIPKEGHDLHDVFELGSQEDFDPTYTAEFVYQEPSFLYDKNVNILPDRTELKGYFQSPYYFLHCEDRIREEFKFKKEIEEEASACVEYFRQKDNPLCSIHFRRTDYLEKSDYHHVQDVNYYNQCLQIIQNNVPNSRFICFSDDIEWCKNTLGNSLEYVHNSPAVDLAIMSKCDMHIIANSSFSWWGAWLSKSSGVLAPSKWFGPSGPSDWRSVYYPGWPKIGG